MAGLTSSRSSPVSAVFPSHRKRRCAMATTLSHGASAMQHVTEYIKLRVLAAIDLAEGRSIRERIRAVSARPFLD